MNGIPWTKKEVETLKRHYPKVGGKCIKFFPNKKAEDIYQKANSLNIRMKDRNVNKRNNFQNPEWSDEELQTLFDSYNISFDLAKENIKNRSPGAIQTKACENGIKCKYINRGTRWSDKEKELFGILYPLGEIKLLMRLTGRSKEALKQAGRAYKVKGKSRRHVIPWEEPELKILKEFYDTVSCLDLCSMIDRSEGQIRHKIKRIEEYLD